MHALLDVAVVLHMNAECRRRVHLATSVDKVLENLLYEKSLSTL